MKKILLVLLLAPVLCFSQKTGALKKIHIITAAGVVTGEAGAKPLFQLSGGLSFRDQFIGAGIGYEQYQFNSFPVFADWRFNFGDQKSVFVYVNAGYNFAGSYHRDQETSKTRDKMQGGFYGDGGVGYRFPAGAMHRLAVSTGYSHKSLVREKIFIYPCGYAGCNETINIYKYRYNYGRIVTKLSWELGR